MYTRVLQDNWHKFYRSDKCLLPTGQWYRNQGQGQCFRRWPNKMQCSVLDSIGCIRKMNRCQDYNYTKTRLPSAHLQTGLNKMLYSTIKIPLLILFPFNRRIYETNECCYTIPPSWLLVGKASLCDSWPHGHGLRRRTVRWGQGHRVSQSRHQYRSLARGAWHSRMGLLHGNPGSPSWRGPCSRGRCRQQGRRHRYQPCCQHGENLKKTNRRQLANC